VHPPIRLLLFLAEVPFGPICTNEVVGRAWLRYWPLNTIGILPTPTYPNVPPAPPATNSGDINQ